MRTLNNLLVSTTSLVAVAYDNEIGWKRAEGGGIATDDNGNPIFVDEGGKETSIGGGYIKQMNSEAARHRTAAADAQKKLAAFGDLDPAAARDAITKMKEVNLDDLVGKGEIEKVRTAMLGQFEGQIKELTSKLEVSEKTVSNLRLSQAFGDSKFLAERVAMPRDFVENAYRNRFKVEGDQVIPVKSDGSPVYNGRGDIASVDEALEIWINERPDKDSVLKAKPAGGSGSQGGGGGRGGGTTMARSEYDALSAGDKAVVGAKLAKGEIKLVNG